jgi:hypothetical protein
LTEAVVEQELGSPFIVSVHNIFCLYINVLVHDIHLLSINGNYRRVRYDISHLKDALRKGTSTGALYCGVAWAQAINAKSLLLEPFQRCGRWRLLIAFFCGSQRL